ASLAAVSRLTLVSRKAGADSAHRVVSEFGKKSKVDPVGGAPGTMVLVEDLFANVPARLKFLKTEAGENGQIRTTLKALALSRPDVEFRIHENGKLWAFYPRAGGATERARAVLGVEKLYEGEAARENVKARAVFASPSDISKTSRQIWLFAQNRWVQDRSMQAAVIEAYRHLLMHGEYPIAAVWLETDPTDIDVNIHPTKSQVKFRDPSLAFRATQASIRETLERAPWRATPAPVAGDRPAGPSSPASEPENLKFEGGVWDTRSSRSKDFHFGAVKDQTVSMAVLRESAADRAIPNFAPLKETREPSFAPKAPASFEESSVTPGVWSSLEVLGQADLTYILCQNHKGLVLVDQHAAHERVAFERLMRAWQGGQIDVQEFLFPLAIDLAPDRVEALLTLSPDLAKLGVRIERLGPGTVGVHAGPSLLKDGVYAAALEKTAEEVLDRGGSFSFEKAVGDLCATMACHSVIRAGQALSLVEMKNLLKEMDEFPLSSFCPHGRPVSVEISFTRLEKEFGRIP
ncbi:MAG TPA: DNA mismatch repair endonuclease MutL, partial [Pseudobdellovibrionaceae bacterium]|nr:DNA mismatch repair endonuclease MutL [Pseudobdellovibrionaceae bacterium]